MIKHGIQTPTEKCSWTKHPETPAKPVVHEKLSWSDLRLKQDVRSI